MKNMKIFIYPINFLLTVLMLAISTLAVGQEQKYFESDVETMKKPWTNLDFYNDPDNFQFAIVSDNTGGMRPGIFEKGVEKLNMMMPEFVLSVGDLIQGYTQDTTQIKKEWEDFEQKVEPLKMPFFYLPGNHDITNDVMQKAWESRYGRRYYKFVYKNVLFVLLDTNDDDDNNLTMEQSNFAIEAINEHPDVRWTFVLMHHPIWKYNTGGRFEKIEAALGGRKHTVLAGHEHRYQYIKRKNSNYYVLGTTGGGTALRGNRFGEFDHIVWVTMADQGPVMANLKLDGILSHDITNEKTAVMARSMLANTNFKHLMLTNQGEDFTDGTAYMRFQNTADVALQVELSFYHHHQVDIEPSKKNIVVGPGEEKIMEIAMNAQSAVKYRELGLAQYYWRLSYPGVEYEDFYLDGNADFPIESSTPDYYQPQTAQFVDNAAIKFNYPFKSLNTQVRIDGKNMDSKAFSKDIQITETTDIEVRLKNSKNQFTAPATKKYEKIDFIKGKKIRRAQPGLDYAYYEGKWDGIPDFGVMSPLQKGVANDFLVGDIAVRKDLFGIRYSGYIDIPEDGMYYFQIKADDAGVLKINDKIICIDGTSEVLNYPNIANSGATALRQGMHPVEIDFVESHGGERLRLYYKESEESSWNFMVLDDFFKTTSRKK